MRSYIDLLCTCLFILAIHGLSSPTTARRGNFMAVCAMAIAVISALSLSIQAAFWPLYATLAAGLIVGYVAGQKIQMTALPQMVALFNGLGGLASALIILSNTLIKTLTIPYINTACFIIGLLTFSGSLVAFAKLQGLLRETPKNIKWFTLILMILLIFAVYMEKSNPEMFWPVVILSLLLGLSLTMPVGGADMPVVISILNALSGWAAVLVGLALNDMMMVIVGTLIGSSGTILSYIMSKAMNRPLLKILWPEKTLGTAANTTENNKIIHSGSPEEAAFLLENARKIIIVPGFGFAAAQAQNALKDMADILENKYNVNVKFAIHPVAGRMPGHMNVLLAEAKIPYDDVYEMADINNEFATADAAYVIGANDITNPAAKTDASSPLYGMPVLDVEKARTVFFVKRSMATGYAGVDNPLFYAPNTIMLFGDAKEITEDIIKNL